MIKATHILYEDGYLLPLKRECEEWARHCGFVAGVWTTSVSRNNIEAMCLYSPYWQEISFKLYSLWLQLGHPLLPPSCNDMEYLGLENDNLYMRLEGQKTLAGVWPDSDPHKLTQRQLQPLSICRGRSDYQDLYECYMKARNQKCDKDKEGKV